MEERLAGAPVEGWRLRRRQPRRAARAPRAAVVGDSPVALESARRLAGLRAAEVVLSCPTPQCAREAALDLGGAVRATTLLDGAAPVDVLIVTDPDPSRVGDVALWAARTCPSTALIVAADDAGLLCAAAARASGLAPWLILAPGGLPRAAAEESRLARAVGASVTQACVPVIGPGGASGTRPLWRYATVAGIRAEELGHRPPRDSAAAGSAPGTAALVRAVVRLALAVLQDRRQVLPCCAWVEGAFGLPGGFVTLPVPVGARGAEEPLPLRLDLEERAWLQRQLVPLRGLPPSVRG